MSEFEKELFDPEVAWSPTATLDRFYQAIQKYGQDKVFNHREFQKTREMWVGAAFFLGFSKMTKKKWWVRPEYNEPPDIHGVSFSAHPKVDNADIEERFYVEITEWDTHSAENLNTRIINKLAGKKYPEYYILVTHAKRPGEVVDLDQVFAELQKHKVHISGSFLLSPCEPTDEGDHIIIGFHPNKLKLIFDLFKERELNKDQMGAIKILRKKGREFHPGSSIPPLPDWPSDK